MSDLVGYPEDRFSHNEAHLILMFFLPGISLQLDQWEKLKKNMDSIEEAIKELS